MNAKIQTDNVDINKNRKRQNENENVDVNDNNWIYESHLVGLLWQQTHIGVNKPPIKIINRHFGSEKARIMASGARGTRFDPC